MTVMNPYLNFDGNCEEVFNFYREVFGGEFSYFSRFNEMPPQPDAPPLSEEDGNKVMHVSLPIDGIDLMGSDISPAFGQNDFVAGNNFSISLGVDSKEEADRLFAGLSAGGTVAMPMDETFWGAYFGMLVDKFGINWMINVESQSEAD